MKNQGLKDQVLQAIDVESEAREILGPRQKNGNFQCWNSASHNTNDKTASLNVSMKNGLWKCFACQEEGDIFDLHLIDRGWSRSAFGKLLKLLAAKYGIHHNTIRTVSERKVKAYEFEGFLKLGKDEVEKVKLSEFEIKTHNKSLRKLLTHYGVNNETVSKYHIGWNKQQRRLYIPIPAERDFNKLVNVRKHDIHRIHCNWVNDAGDTYRKRQPNTRAIYDKAGKVIGVRGHNVAYLYPMSVLLDNSEVWLVGGELKALLLNQFNVPAVTFTGGEGSFHKSLLPRFLDRTVRVLFDIDEAGKKASKKLARTIVDNGAERVLLGTLPEDGLPPNGDITDFLRLNNWDPECLKSIEWTEVERTKTFEAGFQKSEHDEEIVEESPEWDTTPRESFSGLLAPKNAATYVRTSFCVAGRGETPYLLPRGVHAVCEAGAMDARPNMCPRCPMKRHNFEMNIGLTQAEKIELVGQKPGAVRKFASERLRLPKCEYPDIDIDYDSVEKVIIIPTLDREAQGDQYNYRQHQVYLLGDDYLTENMSYEGIGKVLPDPKSSAYTWSVVDSRPLDNDIFSYRHDERRHKELIDRLHNGGNLKERLDRLVESLADHHLQKYGVNRMILLQMLAFMMPFNFSLGRFRNYKICPEVCILGEPRSGKSSTAKDLLGLFGAGRYVDAPTTTTVGMIGGNQSFGRSSVFTWGALPMCNRAICIIDEANKLDEKSFETLTNLRSSGIAERTTATGIRKTQSNVRILWLCNPRHGRALKFYKNGIQAATEVFGSPQDVARLDLLHIQYAHSDARVVNKFHEITSENFYNRETARYHLQWAWHLNEENIEFESPQHIMAKSIQIVETYKTDLLPTAETKFKIARIAAGLSAMAYQFDRGDNLFVTNEAVDLAVELFGAYEEYGASKIRAGASRMPPDLGEIFMAVPLNKRVMLRVFVKERMATYHDIVRMFGEQWSTQFIACAFFTHEVIRKRAQYYQWDEDFSEMVEEWLSSTGTKPPKEVEFYT